MSKTLINKKQNQYIKNINRQKISHITRTNIFSKKKRIFVIKNILKKFNVIICKQLKTTNNIILQFTTLIRINDYKITIIMNSNASTNFISTNFVNKKNYLHDRKTTIIRL